ncbi:PaaI family thioesterase [Zhongshania sp.]|jgi:acyl-coenzyme A thioesterase PaaI-like protein|uniref:PaaI family thioesterase n=1 Tax=Zhongshania sp. TaxID=1971902 RepID=UPI001B4C4E72|nr:PaaI family thioesterase [Zhongshania sp.]MBQ0795436.1 PaaI family thioesterase [Zhongshania sp.]
MDINDAIPVGFQLLDSAPGFDTHMGNIYIKYVGEKKVLGFRVRDHHLNIAGTCHGGVITYLADMQLLSFEEQINGENDHFPTKNLDVDFIAPVPPNAWIEIEADLVRETKGSLYSHAVMKVDGRIVVRTTACYHISK